jgi:FkbM family methyltransferase
MMITIFKKCLKALFRIAGFTVTRRKTVRVSPQVVVSANIAGHKLFLPQSHVLPTILKQFPFYSSNLGRIAKYAAQKYPQLSVIDIGANIGDSLAFVRSQVNAPILCIDGDDQYFPLLVKNAALFKDVVTVKTYISDEGNPVDITVKRTSGTAYISTKATSTSQSTVRTLPEVVNENPSFANAKLLKIDTDGFDCKILKGASAFLSKMKPILFFEYDPDHLMRQEDDGLSIFPTLAQIGYDKLLIYDNYGILMLSVETSDQSLLQQLHFYALGQNSQRYYDICAFHSDDADLFQQALSHEIDFFAKEKSTITMPSLN